ncbi:MAG: hypothetical protein CMD04_01230 [Flavobacteriales bacterium]|nr:hypothetical protein [Flavobacteriales bacterium]
MKRTIIFILLTIVISSCKQNEICTNLGCAVVEKPKKIKKKQKFFKIKKKTKTRKQPQKGLFPEKILKKTN